MQFDESIIGDPFRGQFPEWADTDPDGEVAEAVERQAADLEQLRSEPLTRHHLLETLQRRRQPSGGPADVTQLDFLAGEEASDHLHVSGELLISGHSYDGRAAPISGTAGGPPPRRHAKPYLDQLGMAPLGIGCPALVGRIVRLGHPRMGSRALADLVRTLRARGYTASLTTINPTAGVVKGIGGPHPARSPGRFQADSGPGSPAKVAIIDTGRASQPRTDGWLQGIEGDIDPLDAFPPPNGDSYLDADAGHGTFVTGVVQQIAPGARIKHYRAVDSDGIATEIAVAREMIRAVTEDGANVVNLSLGCHTQDDVPPIAIAAALEIIKVWEDGKPEKAVIVAAAGNFGNTTHCWPAAFPGVVSVAALKRDMEPAPWSTRGDWVRCSTTGQGVRSTFVEGRESALLDRSPRSFGPNPWAAWSGTSFAAAQITGTLAHLIEKRKYRPEQALQTLLGAGRAIPDFGQALKILPVR